MNYFWKMFIKNSKILICEIWITIAKSEHSKTKLQKCEYVWRNLVEFLNSERCKSGAESYLNHPGARPRITGFIFWISVVLTPAVRAACPCAPSFRYFPRPRCCGLIAPFPGPCASSGGRLPEAVFMVFQLNSKGAKVCSEEEENSEPPIASSQLLPSSRAPAQNRWIIFMYTST